MVKKDRVGEGKLVCKTANGSVCKHFAKAFLYVSIRIYLSFLHLIWTYKYPGYVLSKEILSHLSGKTLFSFKFQYLEGLGKT